MGINFSNPTNSQSYQTGILSVLRDHVTSLAKFNEGETLTNTPTNAKQYNPTTDLFEAWNGSTWVEMPLAYVKKVGEDTGLTRAKVWTAADAAIPAFTTRSIGARLVLWPDLSATTADWAIGIESGFTWFSVPSAAANRGFKWYYGTTLGMEQRFSTVDDLQLINYGAVQAYPSFAGGIIGFQMRNRSSAAVIKNIQFRAQGVDTTSAVKDVGYLLWQGNSADGNWINTAGFMYTRRADVVNNVAAWTSDGRYEVYAQPTLNSAMANATGGLGFIEVRAITGAGNAAFMEFHRPSSFAAYFGIDTDNLWKVGGYSMGANAYPIFHTGFSGRLNAPNAFFRGGTWDGTNGTFEIPRDSYLKYALTANTLTTNDVLMGAPGSSGTVLYWYYSGGWNNSLKIDVPNGSMSMLAGTGVFNDLGYRDVPQITQNAAYTFALVDRGRQVFHNEATARVWTIPPVSSVAWPVGSAITLINNLSGGNITITRGSGVTLRIAGGSGTSQDVTLTAMGVCTIVHIASDTWFVSGTGIS